MQNTNAQQNEGGKTRLPVGTWIGSGVVLLLAVPIAFGSGIGGVVILLGLTLISTGAYAGILGRKSWLIFSSRKGAWIATGIAVVIFFLGASIASASAKPGPQSPSPAISPTKSPTSTPTSTPTPAPAPTPTPTPSATKATSNSNAPIPSTGPAAPVQPQQSTVYFSNCAAAKAAGAAPLYRGQPGYRSALDRDGDGIACE